MTGAKFEAELCEFLKELGYWALNIPRNSSGAQPFDVIAIKDDYVFTTDCKVCSKGLFNLSRVEDNQWSAFKVINERTNARIGIVAYYNESMYWIPYERLLAAKADGEPSINLKIMHTMYSREEIKEILGRYMK